jgi:prephenate dehydratase
MRTRTLLVTIPHKVGALQKALNVLTKNNINVGRIESRPSRVDKRIYDFVIDVEDVPESKLDKVINYLKDTKAADSITFLGSKDKSNADLYVNNHFTSTMVPWTFI